MKIKDSQQNAKVGIAVHSSSSTILHDCRPPELQEICALKERTRYIRTLLLLEEKEKLRRDLLLCAAPSRMTKEDEGV